MLTMRRLAWPGTGSVVATKSSFSWVLRFMFSGSVPNAPPASTRRKSSPAAAGIWEVVPVNERQSATIRPSALTSAVSNSP